MINEISLSYEIAKDLFNKEQELEAKNSLLDAIKLKKEERSSSYKKYSKNLDPFETLFTQTLRRSMRSFKSQIYKDSQTLRLLVFNKLNESDRYMFFALFGKWMQALNGFESFKSCCTANDLDPRAVSQHVVMHGNKALTNVFKYGLDRVFKIEELKLMNKAIFSEDDLTLSKYLPREYQPA